MNNWKVEKVEAGQNVKAQTSVTHYIYVSGPKGGCYAFNRNSKNQTWFSHGNTKNVKAYHKAVVLAEAA